MASGWDPDTIDTRVYPVGWNWIIRQAYMAAREGSGVPPFEYMGRDGAGQDIQPIQLHSR
jgi:hypothetical protein